MTREENINQEDQLPRAALASQHTVDSPAHGAAATATQDPAAQAPVPATQAPSTATQAPSVSQAQLFQQQSRIQRQQDNCSQQEVLPTRLQTQQRLQQQEALQPTRDGLRRRGSQIGSSSKQLRLPSLLMRLIDDFLFITSSRTAAEAMVNKLLKGMPACLLVPCSMSAVDFCYDCVYTGLALL